MLGLPSRSEAMSIAGAGVYGMLEGKAKADADFILNKIPRPIAQLGFSGGTALALYLVNRYGFKNQYVKALANGAASVAMYQMGKQGGLFTDATVQGLPTYGVAGELDDDDVMGALAAEGDYVGDDDDDDDIGYDDDDIAGDVSPEDTLAVLQD